MDTLVYSITEEKSDTLYVNLTNRCSNKCKFCIRSQKNDVCGHDMTIKNFDYSVDDIISQFENFDIPNTIVFCGYGEPTLELEKLKEFATYLKTNYPQIKIRVNTNGHANFVHRRDITVELKNLVDEFSVSLNASDAVGYDYISNPNIPNAFEEVKKFIQSATNSGIKTVASVVTGFEDFDPNINNCKNIVSELGAELKIREFIPNGY